MKHLIYKMLVLAIGRGSKYCEAPHPKTILGKKKEEYSLILLLIVGVSQKKQNNVKHNTNDILTILIG